MKLLLAGFLFVTIGGYAQNKPGEQVFTIVEQPASFSGGLPRFVQYIIDSIHVQPNRPGKVIVKFAIDTTGFILPDKTSVIKLPEGMNESFAPELIRVINASPAWMPGRQHGKAVRQQMALPIIFETEKRD